MGPPKINGNNHPPKSPIKIFGWVDFGGRGYGWVLSRKLPGVFAKDAKKITPKALNDLASFVLEART